MSPARASGVGGGIGAATETGAGKPSCDWAGCVYVQWRCDVWGRRGCTAHIAWRINRRVQPSITSDVKFWYSLKVNNRILANGQYYGHDEPSVYVWHRAIGELDPPNHPVRGWYPKNNYLHRGDTVEIKLHGECLYRGAKALITGYGHWHIVTK
jgi:hypothetical protein